MKIRTLIIDDEPIALEKLKSYVSKTPFLELAGECHSAVDAVSFLAAEPIDVIFTDINMPDLDGMEFISSLPTPPMVVFITAYAQYAVESYRLSAIDYLLKPYSFADFQRAANKVLQAWQIRQAANRTETPPQPQAGDSLFVKVDYRYLRVDMADILYIKGCGEYLQIFTAGSDKPLMTLSSFAAIKQKLPGGFLQIHRSYVVNMNRVKRVEKARVVMSDEVCIPIGDSYRGALMEYLAGHLAGPAGAR